MYCAGDHQASSGYLQDPVQSGNDCSEGRALVADGTKRYLLTGEEADTEMTNSIGQGITLAVRDTPTHPHTCTYQGLTMDTHCCG